MGRSAFMNSMAICTNRMGMDARTTAPITWQIRVKTESSSLLARVCPAGRRSFCG
jgi:hypothetical protein